MTQRKKRTYNFNKTIEKEWCDYYWSFIEKHLDKNLSWYGITVNKNITMDIVQKNINLPWNFKYIGLNENITFDFIIDNLNKKDNMFNIVLDIDDIYTNMFLTIDIVNKLKDYIEIDWWHVSGHNNITIDIIEEYIDYIDFDSVCHNDNMTFDFVKKYYDRFKNNFNWNKLSYHKNITMDNILEHIEYPWNFKYVTENHNFNISMINYYYINMIEYHINWFFISDYSSIMMEDIENHLHYPWDWYQVSLNPNITIEFIIKYMDKYPLNFTRISMNKNITLDMIENNLDLPWEWEYIAKKNNITEEFIIKHMDKFTNIIVENNFYFWKDVSIEFFEKHYSMTDLSHIISHHMNLTIEYINNNIDNISFDWAYISHCDFNIEKKQFIYNKYRRYMAAYTIQQWWIKIITTPIYKACRNKINNDYNKLYNIK
jgi:hypothetical protein